MTIHFTHKGYDFKVTGCRYIKGSPGRLSGPPEYCYPPEPPEVDDVKLEIYDDYSDRAYVKLPDPIVSFLMEDDSFYEVLLNAVESHEIEPDYPEDDWRKER